MTRILSQMRDALLLLTVFALMAIVAARLDSEPQVDLTGPFFAIDGDTLSAAGARLRLSGMDAPESGQTCLDASGRSWECGAAARRRLAQLSGDAEITCVSAGRDRYHRWLVRCLRAGVDVNAALVAEGLAVSYGRYGREETAARGAERGIWVGSFERPADWRANHAAGRRDDGLVGALRDWLKERLP